jgi:hypothetical protein
VRGTAKGRLAAGQASVIVTTLMVPPSVLGAHFDSDQRHSRGSSLAAGG